MIAISQSIAGYLEHLGIASTLIYDGVASPELRPDARSHLGLDDAEFVVGGIGRIHEQKGWDVLCRAATMVREQAPEAEFVVVGDGPERQSYAARSECAPVRFVGYEPNASSLLGAFDVLAVPSRWEGFGRVAVEAMLAGVPVIAADVGGLSEVVDDAGLLVPSEQPEPLAERSSSSRGSGPAPEPGHEWPPQGSRAVQHPAHARRDPGALPEPHPMRIARTLLAQPLTIARPAADVLRMVPDCASDGVRVNARPAP